MKYAPELCIIKLFLLDKESFEIYYSQIKEMNFEPEIKSIFKTISSYYVTYPTHIYVSKDEFKLYYDTLFSMSKNKEMIHLLIDTIYSIEISSSIIKDIIRHLIEKDVSLSIISKLTPVIAEDKFGILTTISDELARYDLLLDKQDDSSLFVSSDLEELIKESEKKGILKWRLQCLQHDLGNIQGGILGHIYSRPETGKTSFLASEITYVAQQLQEDETILWCNNEQRGDKVVTRLYSAMLNESDERVINNITKAKELFYKMGGPKIKLYDNGFISMEHIRSMIKVYEPKMVIIDQGDKIMFQGGLKLEGHARLKELYRLFRETAKEFNTHILTVGQASAEASGKKWLEMHHLDNSRTGKPGEMDYIIGIGKTMADEDEELRYINLCKNKLTGRHSKHTLRFNGLTGRYSDL